LEPSDLDVERAPIHCEGRFHHSLAEGGVRVDVAADLPRVALEELSQSRLGDELGGIGSDDVSAEQLPGLGVGDQLDEARPSLRG